MATTRTEIVRGSWTTPAWPDPLPDPGALRLIYGDIADELVIYFDNLVHYDKVVMFLDSAEADYAAVMVEWGSGAVIGVLVYPLMHDAAKLHPAWRMAATPGPAAEVAGRIVADIKELYDRHGTGADDVDGE